MPRELSIDIETYSSEDLTSVGVYRYAESEDFEILLLSYAFDDEPEVTLDLSLGKRPGVDYDRFLEALNDSQIIKTAHNAQFERVCLERHCGRPMPAEQWRCTAVLAVSLGLPRGLAQLATALALPEDQQKLRTGKALITYFSKPCLPTAKNGQRTRNLPQHDPAKWELYKTYNRQDVTVERTVRNRLRAFAPSEAEQQLWTLDQNINGRGIATDLQLVHNAITASEEIKERVKDQVKHLTGLSNPNSRAQLLRWLSETDDIEAPSLNKAAIPGIIAGTDNATVRTVLELRNELTKTSVSKYSAIARAVNADGRLRGTMMFYGARTGRWAGRIFQPQNLPKNTLPDLALARELVREGHFDEVEQLYGHVSGTLSQLVRTALIPAEGHRFLVADFSAIEARVIAWFAQERWRMEVFKTHGKIYEASAAQMFKVPLETIAKGQENYALRQKGKVAELALGYGGAKGALLAMGALDMGLEEKELPGLVRAWRAASPAITKFWWDVGDAALEAVATGQAQKTHGLTFQRQAGFLFITLPSGRRLAYYNPRIERRATGQDSLVFDGTDQGKASWGKVDTYGPRLVENIVQAASRDLLANGLRNLDATGYKICFHVHDEAIVEAPIGWGSLEEMSELLALTPPWAAGLPVKADGYECDFYRKE